MIGLGAATPVLVERWVAEGRLPTIGRFLSQGAYGRLRSVPNRNSAPAWSTMVTGLNPGKHGIYWCTEERPETYGSTFVNGSFRRGEAFWRVLSEQRQLVGVVNVPITFPAEEVNGVLVAGSDSPSPYDSRFTYPSELRYEVVEAAGGEYYVHAGLARYVVAGETDEGLDRLHRAIDKRAAVATRLMETRPWDAFMVVFTESDVVQHFFWRQMEDPSPDDPPRHQHAIRGTYEHLDQMTGRLMAAAGPDTVVLLVSDHGARYDGGLARAIPSWLEHLGLLTYRARSDRSQRRSTAREPATFTFRRLDKRLSPEGKHGLARRVAWPRRLGGVTMSYTVVDWRRTRAFTDGQRPEIWVNLKGRQPQGIVDPGDYEDVRQRIIDAMSGAVCAKSGQPLVRRVWRREEVYSGPFVARSPDLVIEWHDGSSGLELRNPDGTTLRLREQHPPDDPFAKLVNGGHSQDGIVGLLGPGVRPGRIDGAEIADIAPTVLFLRDASIAAGIDGRVLVQALDPMLIGSRGCAP